MTLLKRIILPKNLIYLFFILLHIFLFNINAAEWGDSYRILRASEHVRNDKVYPSDEKRPPFYSLILSIRPNSIDQILWGRIFMFGVSLLFLITFEKFLRLFLDSEKCINVGLFLLALNPVFLYWSIRIYADVFFGLFVLMSFYLLYKWKDTLNFKRLIILGILSGLAVLTRFEGYILFGSIGLGILLHNERNLFRSFKINFKSGFLYTLSFLITISPWILYRNPLTSSYLEEPSGRAYDLNMFWTYISSLLFIFGIVSAFPLILRNFKNTLTFLKDNIALSSFIILELLLILSWPAAVPRLFVPIIPFLILILVKSLEEFFGDEKFKQIYLWVFGFVFLAFYILTQYKLKLQFLVPVRNIFIIISFIQIINLYAVFKRRVNLFLASTFISCLIWSLSIIWIHKDVFISVKNAGDYVSTNLSGVVAYNDVSSVSDWYLNQQGENNVTGYYYNFEKDELLTLESLLSKGMDYLLITNEHNTTMEIDLNKRPYLTLIKEFSYNVNSETFITRVVKINKDYKNE